MESFSEMLSQLSMLKVAVAALAIFITSMAWYSQPLFGRAFIRLSGIRPGDFRPEHARRIFFCQLFTSLIAATLLGMLAQWLPYETSLICAILFLWVFVMLHQLNGFLFRREPLALFLLHTSRSLAALIAGGLVYTFWS